MTDTLNDLRKSFPTRFVDDRFLGEIILIASEDQIDLDLVGQSNCDCISDDYEWVEEDNTRPYHRFIYVRLEDVTEDIAEELDDIFRALDDYPIYYDQDHSDRELKALLEYMEEWLPGELADELGVDESDELMTWIVENQELIWGHRDGSINDQPFNIKEIAAKVKL